MPLIDAARALGFLGMGAALAALAWTSRTLRWRDCAPAVVGVFSLALAAPLQVWTVGGLEQPLVAALLAWGLVLALPLLEGDARGLRAGAPAGLCFALLAVTRPDGALFGVLVGLVLLVSARARRVDLRPALAILGCTLGLVAAQLLFRLGYYGELLPNTSYVKLGTSARRLREGTLYVGLGLVSCAGLVVLALAGLFVDLAQPARRARGLLLAVPCGAWLVYLTVIGGDIFPGRRHLVPVVVILALLARDWAAWWPAQRRPLRSAGLAASVVALAVFAVAQQRDPETERARTEVWEWDCQLTASMLGAAFSRQEPLVAVDPAGCFPFFSRLPSLDMLGLNDAFIARHPPTDRGSEPLGHELGDGAYVLSRRPDLALFCGSRGNRHGCHASGVWLDASDEFHRLYRPVLFEERHPYVYGSWMYVRTDGRIGIQVADGRWTVPGFFLAERGDAVAIRDDHGLLATETAPSAPGRFRDLVIGPGRFTIEVRASGALAGPGHHRPSRGADRDLRGAITARSSSLRHSPPSPSW